ncbi:hypothetical protein E4U41_002801, partial [Claviceps citrina]
MAATAAAAAVFGSTGLVGSRILCHLTGPDAPYQPVHTITRRAPQPSSSSPPL